MSDNGMSLESLQNLENDPYNIPEDIEEKTDQIEDENKSLLLESGISSEEIQLVKDNSETGKFGILVVSKFKDISERLQSYTKKKIVTAGLMLSMLTTSACAASKFSSVTIVPTASETPVATEKIDLEATATAQAEEIKKAERKEKEERLKDIDTTWTFEWLNSKTESEKPVEDILEESWEDARKLMLDRYDKKAVFLYLFVDDTGKGWFTASGPYGTSGYKGLDRYDGRFFAKSRIVDQKLCDEMIASTTDHYIDRENSIALWNPDKEYTEIYYFTQEEDEYGKYNGIYSQGGGWYRTSYDEEGKIDVKYVSPENIADLTDQELDWALEYHNIFDYRFGENGIGRGDVRILGNKSITPTPES